MARAWTQLLTALGLLRRRVHVLCVGLDNSGKTSILRYIQMNDSNSNSTVDASPSTPSPVETTVPTVGFAVEHFTRNKLSFTAFDMSGQGRYRDLWRYYYSEVDAIVFVMDGSDRDRMSVVRDELEAMLAEKSLRQRPIPILFFCNKMDLDGVLTPAECVDALGLDRIRDRAWTICASSALTGEGIDAGLVWLMDTLRK